ncbi:hypothetical protein HUT18_13655 [Streptomyces sp. NA04227]|uniref:LppU/SCO3897 family protein n=1 Tax=Streptomyces sp. NA04227 TaxID=2742136 RepID=UPI001590C389|nr:hypothetical protein [Streptomyces sp. NA04227]QKW07281.1 hypothetical protein HUT18_13655 [Streptomyces sp. NA04227]
MIGGGVMVLVIGGMITLAVLSGEPTKYAEDAKVGDCIEYFDVYNERAAVKVVDCDDREARYKVTARIEENFVTDNAARAACDSETGRNWDRMWHQYQSRRVSDNFALCMKNLPNT